MHGRRVPLVLLVASLAGFMASSCSSRIQNLVTERAASDFGCSAEESELTQTHQYPMEAMYDAKGCGEQGSYYTKCNMFGMCKTLTKAELDAYNRRVDAQNAHYAQSIAARQSSPSPSSSSPSSSSSSSSSSSPSSSSSSSSSMPSNCSFDSDCGGGVKCNSGRCANTSGSKCGFDSDCGGNGAKCNSGKCSNAPDGRCSFNSECPGGSCSSGSCRF